MRSPKGLSPKYVERLERTGLAPEQLLDLSEPELLERTRPKPHVHALQLRLKGVALALL